MGIKCDNCRTECERIGYSSNIIVFSDGRKNLIPNFYNIWWCPECGSYIEIESACCPEEPFRIPNINKLYKEI